MKSLLTISVPVEYEVIHKKGDKVKIGDIIAKKKVKSHKEKILLSAILNVPPKKVIGFLRKKLGASVKKGEIIARREGLLKSIQVLAPFPALLDSVDLKDGSLLLVQKETKEFFELSPVEGLIEGITGEKITISFEGKVIEVEKGKGERVIGTPIIFSKHTDFSDFASEVTGKIVVGKSFTPSALAKLLALEAVGIIALDLYDNFPVAVSLNTTQLTDLFDEKPHNLIVLGNQKRIVIPVAKK